MASGRLLSTTAVQGAGGGDLVKIGPMIGIGGGRVAIGLAAIA